MATKTIAWATGSGNITLTYTGQGNGSITVTSDENDLFEDREQSFGIVTTAGTPEKAVSILIKQKGKSYPTGHMFNFDYTGSVQQVTLPAGRYKLQCWGAQGGNVTGTYAVNGSKGGYSEGVLTLTEKTTLYVFVGGQGTSYTSSASQTSTTVVNGGWNGGGAGVRTSRYNSGNTDGRSFPRGGGGATDISTVTSSLSYSSGRTTRDSASLLARCIVAGGGAGASARYTITTSTDTTSEIFMSGITLSYASTNYYSKRFDNVTFEDGTYKVSLSNGGSGATLVLQKTAGTTTYSGSSINVAAGTYARVFINVVYTGDSSTVPTATITKTETTTSTSTSSGKSNTTMQGGGTSGKGQYPGTQSSAGSGGAFGLGANQSSTNYRYCGGGGGGGWYGGGTSQSDSSTGYVSYSGGGSGFVNTSANASSRPSGYTGLQLDSGTTTAGSSSFESVSGSTETGHSGNGYARITVLGDSEQLPSEYTQLEYIESTGTQYVDTGFKPNNNTRVVMDMQAFEVNANGWAFGGRDSTSKNSMGVFYYYTSNKLWNADYSGSSQRQSFSGIGATDRIAIDFNKNICSINGVSNTFTATTFQSSYPMALFAVNTANTVSTFIKAKLYSCKIYDNDILVRDYIPAMRSDGVIGLYDKLNNVFYSSASDTNFTGA